MSRGWETTVGPGQGRVVSHARRLIGCGPPQFPFLRAHWRVAPSPGYAAQLISTAEELTPTAILLATQGLDRFLGGQALKPQTSWPQSIN